MEPQVFYLDSKNFNSDIMSFIAFSNHAKKEKSSCDSRKNTSAHTTIDRKP